MSQTALVGVFVCACGHEKRSHLPHGGRRAPSSGWVCRKAGCDCREYGRGGVRIQFAGGGTGYGPREAFRDA